MPDQTIPCIYTLAPMLRPQPGHRLIFAFDRMMDEAVIRKHCSQAKFISIGRYLSHRIIWNADGDAGVVRHRGSTVFGIIWELDEAVLPTLDLHHGVPARFDRCGALIRGQCDELATVEYFAPRNHRHGGGSVGELLRVLELAGQYGFPDQYIEDLMDWFPSPVD